MGDPDKAPWLIVLVQVWQQAGYLMVIYLAGLSNIPTDVLEAASIDGARSRARPAAHHAAAPRSRVHDLSVPEPLQLAEELRPGLRHAGPLGVCHGHRPVRHGHLLRRLREETGGLGTAKAILLFLAIALITGIQLSISKRREVQL